MRQIEESQSKELRVLDMGVFDTMCLLGQQRKEARPRELNN